MVPLKLGLRNFMAYRRLEPPLDFTGVHVACLSGPNGAGKSALLDAITWALWGQSRARSDDDLVTLGEQEMEVELEFVQGEEHCRVLRKRTRPGIRKTGQSVLELQIADADGFFRPITGNTLRETQRQIDGLLRLDYQTFINSAMLLQGRADEFTLKAPGERKRVLGEVLGLSRYDEYEERARNEARLREGELTRLGAEIASLEAQVSLRPQYEEELRAMRQAYEQLSALVKAREGALAGLQETQRLREEKRARLAEGKDRLAEARAEMGELAGQEQSLLGRIREHREALAQKEAVSQALEEHRGLAEASERLGRAFQELYRLRQEENRLERTLELAKGELASEELLARREVAQLREAADARQSLQEAVRQAEEELAGLAPQLEEASGQRERLTAVAQELGVLQHTNQQIVLGGQELRAKVDQLNRPGATGVCPLCGSQLGPEGHRRIVEEYQAELERQRELYRANEQLIRTLQTEQERGQAALKALEESIIQQRTTAQTRAATAGRQVAEAERAAQDMVQLQERLTGLQEALAGEAFAPEERAALATTRKSITGLGYDQERHQAIQARLRELEPFVSASQRLQEAERQLPHEEADLARVQEAVARWRARLSDEAERTASLERELAALPDVVQELSRAHRELEDARSQLTAASTRLGGVQAQLEHCEALERVLRGQRAEATQREQEKGIYDELALAFGRRGLQALLIESALPELEQEANLLLGRMTDNRMHLALETQRQTRSGAIAETLDIKISDELGTRAYELYSGGEAFRINFALRIAISKLLARRAGAPLPTLIVDEGFGTQDTAGREKLIEAVNAIADDFERILVITHIDELKDAFPVRIEVTKTPEGSRVDVR